MVVKKIRKLCIDKGTNLTALERELGMGRGVIARWGRHSPRVDKLKAVADYFGVSIDELLKEE